MQPENGASASVRQLSVVVGSIDSSRSLASCLDALRESCRECDAELIVVDADGDPATLRAASAHAGLRLISMPADTLTPRLWSEGLAVSSGEVVAFTTGHCFVSRRDLPDGSWSRDGGFWEHDVNRAIRASGRSIVWAAAAVADFGRSFAFASICRHRFAHGQVFGMARVAQGESRSKIIIVSPLVPFVLAIRVGKRVMGRPAYRMRFVAALPLIIFHWRLLGRGRSDRSAGNIP